MLARTWRERARRARSTPTLAARRHLLPAPRSTAARRRASRATLDAPAASTRRVDLEQRRRRPDAVARPACASATARCARALERTRCSTAAPRDRSRCTRRSSSRRSRPTQLAEKYPAVLIVNRGAFKLTLYKNLKPAKTYGIAVGQVGLETPAGLYHIQNKAVNPAWTCRTRPGPATSRGKVIPGGTPENPLKARWLGIFDGAGIHGTDADGSIGTAASHGCIRMRIPDVEELYDQVPGRRAGLHRLSARRRARAISSTGDLLPALLQQGGVVVGVANAQGADEHAPLLLAHHRVPHGRSRRRVPWIGCQGAAAARRASATPASTSWRRVAT